jgi:hypothetical protein
MQRQPLVFRLAPWLYLALLVVGIPWYWEEGSLVRLFGAPVWVVIAILTATAAAILTACLLRHPWVGERADEGE